MTPPLNESDVWQIAQASVMPPWATCDDCFHETAILGGEALKRVYSVDAFQEGVHFDLRWMSFQSIGWRSLAASLSDIASCGALPRFVLSTVCLPADSSKDSVEALYEGMKACLDALNLGPCVVGGDTTAALHWSLTHTVIGDVPRELNALPHRQGGSQHQCVVLFGSHGLSHLGLRYLQTTFEAGESPDAARYPAAQAAFGYPLPLLKAGQAVAKLTAQCLFFEAIAMMDTSDGLADACLKLASTNKLTLAIEEAQLPLHSELREAEAAGLLPSALDALLYGGEDFGLLVLLPQRLWEVHAPSLEALGATCIGKTKPLDASLQPVVRLALASGETRLLSLEQTFHHFGKA